MVVVVVVVVVVMMVVQVGRGGGAIIVFAILPRSSQLGCQFCQPDLFLVRGGILRSKYWNKYSTPIGSGIRLCPFIRLFTPHTVLEVGILLPQNIACQP